MLTALLLPLLPAVAQRPTTQLVDGDAALGDLLDGLADLVSRMTPPLLNGEDGARLEVETARFDERGNVGRGKTALSGGAPLFQRVLGIGCMTHAPDEYYDS